jgi:hypothetical protein
VVPQAQRISGPRLLKRGIDIDRQHGPNCGAGDLMILRSILRGEPGRNSVPRPSRP